MDTKKKLAALREKMKAAGIAAFIQPVHDAYMSEYPPESDRRVWWLSGFSGSAGMVAITHDKAAIFIDGRYTLQAQAEVDATLFEAHNSNDKKAEEWLAGTLRDGETLAYDPSLFTLQMVKRLQAALAPKHIAVVESANLIDAVWSDRPSPPATPLFIHDARYNGEDSASKRRRIARAIRDNGADAALITAPDSVCWLLNIRAHDVGCSPFLLAPMLVDNKGFVQLFVAPHRAGAVLAHLGNEVTLSDTEQLADILAALGRSGKKILCDSSSVPVRYTHILQNAGATLVEASDPCQLPKAMKNETEIACIKHAHLRDGVAVTRLLYWLDAEVKRKQISEMEVAEQLLALRREVEGFTEPSFDTIAGSGPNGAIVHYRADAKSNRVLQQNELLLLDSGGQYPDGTTDITRTVAIGSPTAEHIDRFTRVLKGHIAIATAQFPDGTRGSQLDALARQYLWQAQLDYDHGTGHGVGQFLCVHEGPQRISKRGADAALAPGMVVSNEPGYYKAGDYGIRIENLVAVRRISQQFLGFETLTCAPIDTRLVDPLMLTAAEKQWLNDYHAWVLACHRPFLSADAAAWLNAACRAI